MKYRFIFIVLFISLQTMIYAELRMYDIQLAKDLRIISISNDIYVVEHSYPWPANSLIINLNDNNILLVDTPYSNPATQIVLNWINENFQNKTVTAINSGFHIDNLGGNRILRKNNIDIFGSDKTIELIDTRGQESIDLFTKWLQKPGLGEYKEYYEKYKYIKPNRIFNISEGKVFYLDNDKVEIYFPGETHSPDNVVVYIKKYKLLFGGCMILSKDKVGNIADANIREWPKSLEKLFKFDVEIVIPGHGLLFSPQLIQKTIDTLKNDQM